MNAKTDQPPQEHEGDATTRDGEENGGEGKSIADQAEAPPVPEIAPKPLGPGGTVPMPKMPGRKQPPTKIKVVVTQAACEGAGQLDEEAEVLLIVRGSYYKAETIPKKDGEGRVTSRDYTQTVKPNWIEDFDTFLAANGLKLVSIDEDGKAVAPEYLLDIEEIRRVREGKGNDED